MGIRLSDVPRLDDGRTHRGPRSLLDGTSTWTSLFYNSLRGLVFKETTRGRSRVDRAWGVGRCTCTPVTRYCPLRGSDGPGVPMGHRFTTFGPDVTDTWGPWVRNLLPPRFSPDGPVDLPVYSPVDRCNPVDVVLLLLSTHGVRPARRVPSSHR